MKFRTEWKYICTDFDLDLLGPKLSSILKNDQNAQKKTYNVHSLYFDDYHNNNAFDNDAGVNYRHKWRIRYYDDNSEFIRLEKKNKQNDLCYKQSCVLTQGEYKKIIAGDIDDVFWNAQYDLLKKFCIEINNKLLKPKIIIDYERTAFVDSTLNVRITFDRTISGSLDLDSFLDNSFLRYPVQDLNHHVLEVKFDDILPDYLERILHSNNLQRNTFSKYYLGRLVLERNIL